MQMTFLGDLVGDAPPLDPAAMQYKAMLALERGTRKNPELACQGCLFKGQRSKVCVQAGQLARLADMPDCEDVDQATGKTFIYQVRVLDSRQISIIEGENNDPD